MATHCCIKYALSFRIRSASVPITTETIRLIARCRSIPGGYSFVSVVKSPGSKEESDCDDPCHSRKSSNLSEIKTSRFCPDPLAVTWTTARSCPARTGTDSSRLQILVGKAAPLLTWTAIQSSRSPPSAFPPNMPTRLIPNWRHTQRSIELPRERLSRPRRCAAVSVIRTPRIVLSLPVYCLRRQRQRCLDPVSPLAFGDTPPQPEREHQPHAHRMGMCQCAAR